MFIKRIAAAAVVATLSVVGIAPSAQADPGKNADKQVVKVKKVKPGIIDWDSNTPVAPRAIDWD